LIAPREVLAQGHHDDVTRTGDSLRSWEILAIERPLPEERFETGRWLTPRVGRFARIMVRNNRYSGPRRPCRQPRGTCRSYRTTAYPLGTVSEP
jgi:hypothetical protein